MGRPAGVVASDLEKWAAEVGPRIDGKAWKAEDRDAWCSRVAVLLSDDEWMTVFGEPVGDGAMVALASKIGSAEPERSRVRIHHLIAALRAHALTVWEGLSGHRQQFLEEVARFHSMGFAGMFSGRLYAKKDGEALVALGLLEKRMLEPADGDGFIIEGRRSRLGFAATQYGRAVLRAGREAPREPCPECDDTGWSSGPSGTVYGGIAEQVGEPCPRGCEPEGEVSDG